MEVTTTKAGDFLFSTVPPSWKIVFTKYNLNKQNQRKEFFPKLATHMGFYNGLHI
jgi:hypothetical protein